jgi:thioredoxin reductase
MDERYDVVVIGGGVAGLGAALTLARSRRRVLVIDAGAPRNAPAEGVHNYLGQEGVPPLELLRIGRGEVAQYGGEVVDGVVEAVDRVDEQSLRVRWTATGNASTRTVAARRIVLATGLVDELPAIPGVAEGWGHSVLHCPYCHGWEVRDRAIGILGTSPAAVHHAMLFRQLSDDIVLFAHIGVVLDADQREEFAARGIRVVEGEVAGLDVSDDGSLHAVLLADGTRVAREAVALAPRFTARLDAVAGLGLEPTELVVGDRVFGTHVATDASGATAVAGVWAVGNSADLMANVIGSAAAGVNCGARLNGDLVIEDTRLAVEARRSGVPVQPAVADARRDETVRS